MYSQILLGSEVFICSSFNEVSLKYALFFLLHLIIKYILFVFEHIFQVVAI